MGRLALKIPPSGSNTDMMPNGTPTPGVRLAFWAAKREEACNGGLQVKSVEPCATTTEIRTELMMQVLY